MMDAGDEESLLRSVALQNAHSIFLVRQRTEQELVRTREALELKTRELADARYAAQEANEAKSRFLNMISHELRTPLGAIGGYADLIDAEIQGPLTEGQRKFIVRIRHNQQHLLSLVNELLDLAKIESGRVDLELAPVALRTVLESVQRMIEPQIDAQCLRLEVNSSDSTLLFFADRARVEQIVLNLLSNAVKFSAAGSSIMIATTAAADVVSLAVRDSGVGISPDKLEAVFEPFVQAASTLADRPRGTGLGLTISRQLARSMGGNLTVESVIGNGSTFTLSLPRAEAGVRRGA